ncbi:MAG: NAD(P)-binding protein, partial [Myxococcota bacterium]|nr:NAD(P)-binding protein [Myxococcota bacterium]
MSSVPRDRDAPRLTRGLVAEPASALHFHTGTWSQERPVHRPTPSPCHDACPAGEDPRAWLAHVQEGHLRRAWEALVEANPLPAVTGRVCPHPCEARCHRGRFDEPIAIHAVERELGDAAIAEGWPYPMPSGAPADAPARVAIVGAGPAGLSAAYHLRRLGHAPVLFDALPAAGGLLRSAI